jgi:hypothetical protein
VQPRGGEESRQSLHRRYARKPAAAHEAPDDRAVLLFNQVWSFLR